MKPILSVFVFFFVVLVLSQERPEVDFQRIKAEIKPHSNNFISSTVQYDFLVLKTVDTLAIDAVGNDFSKIYLGKQDVSDRISYDGKKLKLGLNLPPGQYQLKLDSNVFPKQAVYFMGFDDEIKNNEQIWTQGQGKYTSHWLPSFDDMNEKVEIDLTIHVSPKYTVIANGKLKSSTIKENIKSWKFNMNRPMSSYLAAFAIGNFDKKVIYSSSGIPIELYYEPKDSLKIEPTYRYTKELFDFLEKEIGVSYPWQNYKQVPVMDFLYAGMENTGCTIFSNAYVIDSTAFVDKNYVNVNAHELAHQWFGNLVTEQNGKHHWLHEGFATYYAYLAEQELFGDDYFYWRLYETAKTLHNLSENGDGEALTNPNANSLTFYEKGAWALAILSDRVGEASFRKGIKNYLNRFAFKNVTISDFLTEVEEASQIDLADFQKKWLESEEFPWEEVKDYLVNKSESMRIYFDLKANMNEHPERFDALMELWNGFISKRLKGQLIKDFPDLFLQPHFFDKLKDESVEVRQAMITATSKIPVEYQLVFEEFLNDPSYVTKENALFKLWLAFPEDRANYLNKTKNTIGFPNKNIRLLWLTLALATPEYLPEKKNQFYEELNSYTSPQYHFEVRQLAFQYLNEIKALNNHSLLNLIDASSHHVWQFKKSARNLLRGFVKVADNKRRLKTLEESMSSEQKKLLNNVLNP